MGMKQVIEAFSVSAHMRELCGRSPQRNLACLGALRALSMFWIILGHTVLFQYTPVVGLVDAMTTVPSLLVSFYGQFLMNGNFAVDTFFFLSGLLTAYVYIQKAQKGSRMPTVLEAIVLRWLRLTPLYALIVGFYACLAKYLGSGPLWYRFVAEIDNCKYWWTHLLYINNFYPSDFHQQCLPWAWYLALDMQFFIIGTLLLKLYMARIFFVLRTAGLFFTILLLLVSTGAGWIVADTSRLDLLSGDKLQNMMYDKPWVRAPAYAIGFLFAYLVSNDSWKNRLLALPRLANVLLLVIALGGFVASICVPHNFNYDAADENWSKGTTAAYLALSRPLWTASVALLVLVCFNGHGGFINKLLTARLWEPLGKLTFAAYLIHPMLMRIFYYQRVQLIYFSTQEHLLAYTSFLALAYGIAVFLYFTVEAPFGALVMKLKRQSPGPGKQAGSSTTPQ